MTAQGEDSRAILVSEFGRLAAEIEHHRAEMSRLGQRRRDIIRALNADGMGYGAIAEACGVSKGLIQNMAFRRRELADA